MFSPKAFVQFKRYLSGLIVSETKTVDGLNRLLTESPFRVADLNQARLDLLNRLPATRCKPHGVLSVDDTLLTHYGQHVEHTAKLYDPVDNRHVWAHNLVTLHYSEDDTDDPVDFHLWQPADLGGVPTTYNFTGQRWDSGTGLYWYRSRWYDPVIGRFLQPDPLVPEPGNSQALNRYAYVYNNPLRYTDPSGHCPWCIPVALGALKLLDWGWTAWDVYQSGRTLSDPNASDLDRRLAELNIILALSLEGGEPDDILPVSLPADDLARRGLIRTAREALAAGDETALRNLPDWLRPMVRGMVTEERMLAQLGRQGQKRLLEVRLGEEVVKTIPDYVDDKVIGEIKDVAYLSTEKQIQAHVQYALEHGLIYELHIRPDTKLSQGVLRLLKDLDDRGLLNLLRDVPAP